MSKSNSVRVFTGPDAEIRATRSGHVWKALCRREKSRAFCIDNRIALVKASNEGGDTLGGFLVPTETNNAITIARNTYGAFRKGADKRPSGTDAKVHPRWFGGLTANFVSEGSAIPESSFQLDAIGTSLKKAAVLGRLSTELLDDSEANVGEFITGEVGYALAALEDDCGFNGDGSSNYRKIIGLGTKLVGTKGAVTAASGHNTFLTLDNTDIGNLMGGVMDSAIPGSAWYCSAMAYAQTFCRLAAVSGGLTATMLPDGTIRASFLGFPVHFSSKLPNVTTSLSGKPMLFFGNLLMSSVIVDRDDNTVIAVSEERALDADQVLIRGARRLDIVNHSVGDSNNAGAVAMLVGN